MVAAVVAVAAAMQNPVEAVEAVVVEAFVAAADSNSTKCAANMTPSAVVMSGRRIDSSGTEVSEATVSEAEDAGRRKREQEELGGPIRADKGSRIGVSACDQKISGRESRLTKFFPALNFWHRYGSWEGFCRGIYI